RRLARRLLTLLMLKVAIFMTKRAYCSSERVRRADAIFSNLNDASLARQAATPSALHRSVNDLIIPRWQCARCESSLADPIAGRCGAILRAPSPGGCQMRLLASSLLIGCTAFVWPAPAHATSWTSAKFPGEQD